MKNHIMVFMVVTILFMGTQYACAGEKPSAEEIRKEIYNNISDEFVTCTAFFFIGSEALRRSGKLDLAAGFKETCNSALEFAFIAAKQVRTEEMAQKVCLARFELNMNSMIKEIDKDYSNLSILLNKYGDRCKEIMEDPEKIMDEWAERIFKKYNID